MLQLGGLLPYTVFTLAAGHSTIQYGMVWYGTLTFSSVNWYNSELKRTEPG